jgi:hypothetical protein
LTNVESISLKSHLTNKQTNRELPPHPNVVQMFGVSLDGPQPVLVLEYCAGGIINLLNTISDLIA